MELITKTCIYCGKQFQIIKWKQKNKTHCSYYCAKKHARERYKRGLRENE